MVRQVVFVGVTTGQSSIMRIFPRWASRLGLGDDVEIQGCDLPLHAPAERYRQVVLRVRDDPNAVGAVVTSHKMNLYQAAGDLFDEIDESARLLGEVSAIAVRGGKLCGWAKDSVTAGRAIERLLDGRNATLPAADVLCFGAGGAGHAIALYLLTQPDQHRPWHRIVFTDRDPKRLQSIENLRNALRSPVDLVAVQAEDAQVNDHVMAALADGSLVINATGIGKDAPGSPITDAAQFPRCGIAWDLNYRGERHFLQQAGRQADERNLLVADGWDYFILGWTAALEEVFDRPISRDELRLLAVDAAFVRKER
jgi:shikimate 5-dehydrogenase